MKVFQTIHKYSPHIPWFEERYGIHDQSNHSFSDLQKLLLEDGYASSYILLPAIEGKTEEVFFTLWNYDRMQLQWAKENGLHTQNLQEIKRAQIEQFKPDVFYDFSAMLDKDFVEQYPLPPSVKKLAWYGIIEKEPLDFTHYDARITLHRPYLLQWKERKLPSFEMQPAFDNRWLKYNQANKDIDILFYGQFLNRMFRDRNNFMTDLLKYAEQHPHLNIKVHLQLQSSRMVRKRIAGFDIPKWHVKFPPEYVVQHALPPIYGSGLYETIGRSKFVINGYTNENKMFKSNMRLFESLGCGSLLISEQGHYPEGFEEQKNYLPYSIKQPKHLFKQLENIISSYSHHQTNMKPYIDEVRNRYSKQNQWLQFQQLVGSL